MQLPEHIVHAHFSQSLPADLQISEPAAQRIRVNRNYLDERLRTGQTYYGINTGFGSLGASGDLRQTTTFIDPADVLHDKMITAERFLDRNANTYLNH